MAAKKPTRVKGETVPPTKTLALMKKIGTTGAAKALGVSTTTLHNARNKGLVSRVIEVAAAGMLATEGAAPTKTAKAADTNGHAALDTVVVLLEIRPDQMTLVEKMAEALHANLVKP